MKILRFRKRRGKKKKIKWIQKRKRIKEVKEIKYLEYTMKINGGQKAHTKERTKKGTALLGYIWGIRKRKFGKN